MRATAALCACAILGLAGCASDVGLINIKRNQTGPDEFAILPGKPIELPQDFSSLPPPTPGGANRTDPTPEADAVAALGGNPARVRPTGQATGDGALLRNTGRFGTDPSIRADLAAEDERFRQGNRGRLLERWARLTLYYQVYEPQSLDQEAELDRVRRAGARTPGAPPPPPAE